MPNYGYDNRDSKGRFIKGHQQFNTGRTWYIKGTKLSEETKDKMRATKVGNYTWRKSTIPSKETKNKMRLAKLKNPTKYWEGKHNFIVRGENHPNWKGGVSKINRPERHYLMETLEYKMWRRQVFERDNYICQICNRKKEISGKLHADHKIPWIIDEKRRFDVSNGQTLCIDCHLLKTIKERNLYARRVRI